MKARYLTYSVITFLLSLVLIACSDNDSLPPENKALAFSDTTNIFFSSLTGSPDGAVTDIALGEYRQKHIKAFTGGGVLNNQFGKIANPSIEFVEGVDTVILKGHAYMLEGLSFISTSNMEERFQYKFEDDKLMLYKADKEKRWYTFGYGNKERIDVFYAFYVVAPQGQSNNIYYWDALGTSTFYLTKFMTKEEASRIDKNAIWETTFNWVATKYPNDNIDKEKMTYKCNGASYSVYKFTFLPKTKM